ncbi:MULTISPECIES: type 1 glutamine amidotransferase domain-containing protein [Thermaerobacter]|uniref:Type 1 glutamine amidotransferase domain-containing protein n=1 Tax=Thermaerobacter composti TaxID=554949 RepID=A0ABZ0QPT5_9FIRM|nr:MULTISPECIES: type 1 glutamine amidotransferase domain-containing protein [Thermaerobacter]QBS37445.1 type 1 glutamine amidotransferase [Thermaerobacter sp. FW80]WPD19495.1 type 1 glutamine amidotransferase domain-containing protein [Thermaerobacter composti]
MAAKRIAILVDDLYEDLELWYPYYRLLEAGHQVDLIGSERDRAYTSKHHYPAKAVKSIAEVRPEDYDGVVIPGGYAPDRMRRDERMVRFVRQIHDQGKLVAAICHAGWMLVSADVLRGRRATSVRAIRDDMRNAGCEWVDEPVVVDGNLVTSRTPDDLPAYMKAILAKLGEA